jgi:hypothetical protein
MQDYRFKHYFVILLYNCNIVSRTPQDMSLYVSLLHDTVSAESMWHEMIPWFVYNYLIKDVEGRGRGLYSGSILPLFLRDITRELHIETVPEVKGIGSYNHKIINADCAWKEYGIGHVT